jgi:hypothetical protein
MLVFLVLSASHFIFVRYAKLQKRHFRSEMLKRGGKDVFAYTLEESALYKDRGGIEWEEEGKELVINGKYHEIIQITCKNGMASLFLIRDDLENKLFADHFNLNNSNPTSLPGTLLHIMGLLFVHGLHDEFIVPEIQILDFLKGETPFALSSYSRKLIKPPMFRAFI